jgi:hypothetical protein
VLTTNDWFNFNGIAEVGTTAGLGTTRDSDPFGTARIFINNQERTIDHPAAYYRLVQPWQSHTRYPQSDRRVYCYAFGLKPEDIFDTGSVNFSRVDNAVLAITYRPALGWAGQTHIYARNKNIMKIVNGQAGKKYAA